MTHNIFRNLRDSYEASAPKPEYMRSLKYIEFRELEAKVLEGDVAFAEDIFCNLYAGDVYLVKGALSKDLTKNLRKKSLELFRTQPSQFFKMVDGTPNFHRYIDPELAKNYSVPAVKHAAYFFPWNGDPSGIFKDTYRCWKLLKYIGGFNFDEYEENIPSDLIVDRIQVCIYPPGQGSLGTHVDPFVNQRFFISGYLSKRGEDFNEGGVYVLDSNDNKVDLEPHIEVGDLSFGYSTIKHGVDLVDPGAVVDYDTHHPVGRWFLGLYSNDSDMRANRRTSVSK